MTLTLSAYFEQWIALRAAALRPRTVESYRATFRLHIAPALGRKWLRMLRPAQITQTLATICATGHTRTAELVYVLLRKLLADAALAGAVGANPMARVQRPQHRPRRAAWLSADQLSRYLLTIQSDPYRIAWLLAICCGLRRGEICGLRWQDVDFTGRQLHVTNQRQLIGGKLIDGAPKSDAGMRTVPVPDQLLAQLRGCRQLAGYVIVRPDGLPITPNGLYQAHRRALDRAGLAPVPLHALRHTMAATAVSAGVPVRVLQPILGHAHYSTTADTYGHIDPAAMRNAIDQLAAIML